MLSPDLIADQALILTSQWQREALPTRDEAMLMLWRFQAERAWQQDNQSEQAWRRVNDVVRGTMEQANG